jgi:hypothetical protein
MPTDDLTLIREAHGLPPDATVADICENARTLRQCAVSAEYMLKILRWTLSAPKCLEESPMAPAILDLLRTIPRSQPTSSSQACGENAGTFWKRLRTIRLHTSHNPKKREDVPCAS